MKIIEPIAITDAVLTNSNIAATTYPPWDAVTNFALDDYVYVAGVAGRSYRTVYQSLIANNVGIDPSSDDGTNWLEIGATDRFKPFDRRISDPAVRASQITYSLTPSSFCDGIAFFGLNAGTVRVQVFDDASPEVEIYDETTDLVDTTEVVDWLSFFFGGVEYDTEAVLTGVPAYSGYRVDITIDASSGNAEVGQIVLGKTQTIGTTLDGTAIGIEDFSTKERDDFGNHARIVEKPFADTTTYQVAVNSQDARRIKRIIARNRASPAVYFIDQTEAIRGFGTMVYGFFNDFEIPLSSGEKSFMSIEIEGLT
jgi:hypothetical protein